MSFLYIRHCLELQNEISEIEQKNLSSLETLRECVKVASEYREDFKKHQSFDVEGLKTFDKILKDPYGSVFD